MLEVERAAAVGATIGRVKAIVAEEGVTRDSLKRIEAELMALAAQEQLFPFADFPPPPPGEKAGRRYLLHSEPDDTFALYMNALNPGNETKPHDHTTWAVVVAVSGQELNRRYERTDDGSVEGRATLRETGQVMVEPGRGITLMPEDIHSIHTSGSEPTRHLHLYGLALERLDGRLGFDPEAGTVTRYNRAYMQPTAGR
jgi:predicted metal-dependent enzyme (double-stranded beta helix superfamily)